ncbi:hypothetical protein EV421DRAFT_1737365 [Armillaria borealis]|uniref:Uncharacterized protein n=1 Tax=Armillaria borealis TaxID=47425 RepID=A0AA39JE43_9AGAR|nr:hypothetical protein EV421DRAFT_1737365 [Armillaria borealis]
MMRPKPTAEKRVADDQGGGPNKKNKQVHVLLSDYLLTSSSDRASDGNATNASTLSNTSTNPGTKAVATPPPSPSKAVVNFAETGVQLPVGVIILDGVGSAAIDVSSGTRGPVPVVAMHDHCCGNLGKIKRILNSYILMPSYGRLHNIYTADPKDFQLNAVGRDKQNPTSWQIGNRHSDSKTVSFYITEILASFLATVLNFDVLTVPVKEGGLYFSTFKQGAAEWDSTSRPPKRGDHGPDIRSSKKPVPIFDGRENFKLREYWDLNPLRGGEVSRYSTALVIFTIGKFRSQNGMHVSFNVQSIIALADRISLDWSKDPDPEWHESLFDEKALGVLRAVPYELFDESTAANNETDDDDGEDVGVL